MRRKGVGFIANLEPEQRIRYYYWWRKYLVLKWVSRTAFVLFFAAFLASLANKPLQPVIWSIAKPAFYVSVVSGIWWGLL